MLDRGAAPQASPAPYQVQAAIAAVPRDGAGRGDTDWPQIAALYAELARLPPSPVVELNRAVAVAMADGPAAGLPLVDAPGGPRRASTATTCCPATRADLLRRLGRRDEAAAAYRAALDLVADRRRAPLPGPTPARGVRRVGIMAGWFSTG